MERRARETSCQASSLKEKVLICPTATAELFSISACINNQLSHVFSGFSPSVSVKEEDCNGRRATKTDERLFSACFSSEGYFYPAIFFITTPSVSFRHQKERKREWRDEFQRAGDYASVCVWVCMCRLTQQRGTRGDGTGGGMGGVCVTSMAVQHSPMTHMCCRVVPFRLLPPIFLTRTT